MKATPRKTLKEENSVNTFRKIAFGMLTIAMAATWSPSLADGKFVTADMVRFHDGNPIFSTLTATEENSVRDGQIIFNGNLYLTNQNRAVPLTATLAMDGEGKTPDGYAILDNRKDIQITGSFEDFHDNDISQFTKSFYSIKLANEEISSSMVVTNDPLPVVGWLLLAGLGYLAAKDFYIIQTCDSSLTSRTDIDLSSLTFSSQIKCND